MTGKKSLMPDKENLIKNGKELTILEIKYLKDF